MRLWLGVATFLAGALLLFLTTPGLSAAARARPPWQQRLGAALGALGLAVLASTQQGLGWTVSSICFSLIAIILLVTVLWVQVRR